MASTDMLEIIQHAKEELKKFNDISLEPVAHVYSDSTDTVYTSVTTFVKKYAKEFDKNRKALECALRNGRLVNEVLEEWEMKGAYARRLGTEIHSVMEHLWKKDENVPNWKLMDEFPGMKEDFEFRKGVCEELYGKMSDFYEPIANEIIVNDRALGIAGTIDFVAYNKKTESVDILDWKTSKSFSVKSGKNTMRAPFDTFPNTNVSEYSLQLSLYKYMVEKHTRLKIGELRLFQIPKTGKVKTMKCYDMVDLIRAELFSAELLSDGEIIEYAKK